mgnify:CR=1 FL=1
MSVKSLGDGLVKMECGQKITIREAAAHLFRCQKCGQESEGVKPNKFHAIKAVDPETGRKVDSKTEMEALTLARREARSVGTILAVQPEFIIEGGKYRADFVEIFVISDLINDYLYNARVRFTDAKGFDTAASRKARQQP